MPAGLNPAASPSLPAAAAAGAQPSWQDVLAECEASAAEAEALLDSRSAFDADRFLALTAMDLWQLSLPPLPMELRDRALAVHQRQLRLQADLSSAMLGIAQQIQLTQQLQSDSTTDAAPLPHYLDRSA